MLTSCLFCGHNTNLVFVHGHYQCPVCKTNALPCCDGDNCNNSFIAEKNTTGVNKIIDQKNSPENLPGFKKQQNQ
jgi:hypothetical protein